MDDEVEPPRIGDHYADLGVSQTANRAQIRKAYLNLARTTYPDKKLGKNTDTADFRKVQEAWECLSDSNRRADYDKIYFDVQDSWSSYRKSEASRRAREERRTAEEQAKQERKEAEAERIRKLDEQRHLAQEKARLEKIREEKMRQAEERSREAARRAWDEKQRAAKERIRQERIAEAEKRSEEAAERLRVEHQKAAAERLRATQIEERLDAARRIWEALGQASEASSQETEPTQFLPVDPCAHPQFQWPKQKRQAFYRSDILEFRDSGTAAKFIVGPAARCLASIVDINP
ncbi:hypothetical protein NPX13_g853 [Xylaria arbuscula]|uniref:J domain-containing protein n=1 Tax=Xylaria arbuscula TaxID=114810 RepID=A0A9W8TS91_9PEZI|nr:hypothetical protein NPX13_g853 [Xylaria arbuscula]